MKEYIGEHMNSKVTHMIMCVYSYSTQEDHQFKASLRYVVKYCSQARRQVKIKSNRSKEEGLGAIVSLILIVLSFLFFLCDTQKLEHWSF